MKVIDMFSRKLNHMELNLIKNMVSFIKQKHAQTEGHDYSHVLEVTRYAVKIAQSIPEDADPFILIVGALFHDIGRVIPGADTMHGLVGATIAEEYFECIGMDRETIVTITNVITAHSPTSMIPPKTIEEKIVYDADAIDRLGWIGVMRGIMGKKGSIEAILERTLKKRSEDFYKMHFDASRELGKDLHIQSAIVIKGLRKALDERIHEVDHLNLPI
jgi:uncharacterized protein